MTNSTRFEILLVEDNAADIELTRHTFARTDVALEVHVAQDGDEALDFLFQRGAHALAPRPDLVLLDLNLPGADGREVLAVAKADETLKRIPIIMLTTSSADFDVESAYSAGANAYLLKPVQLEDFRSLVHSLLDFRCTKVRLPGRR